MLPYWTRYLIFMIVVASATFVLLEFLYGRW